MNRRALLALALSLSLPVLGADPMPARSPADLVTDAVWLKVRSLPAGRRPRP